MCGIFGFTHQTDNPSALLKTMGNLQIHRGPDGEGYYADRNISLGMRRLSIIDVEHGNQPFFNESRSVVVVCNGEIYNYRELRNELRALGYTFRTNSDIEVIPHLYDRFGIDFIHKLNGMYAIALYDKSADSLFLIRDRLGIKPLYYARFRDEIAFSSELKSILAIDVVDSNLDFSALSTYLELLYIPAPLTPFANVRKLESGSYLLLKDNQFSITKYWDPMLDLRYDRSEHVWIDEIETLLLDSIELELRSDVPVGSFLSGGVDSALVTACAAKSTPLAFSSFHMRWKDVRGKIDESPYADMVARRYGTRHTMRDVSQIDLPGLLPKLVWHLEEPFADAAFVPTYILAQIASEQVKVVLSGAGGDELFGGYPHHLRSSLLRSLAEKLLFDRNPYFSYFDAWKRSYFKRWGSIFPWYVPGSFKERFERKFKENCATDRSNAVMLADISCYLQDDILFLTDKMTMATSLECRVPLLDHRLVELSLRIPSSFKIRNNVQKHILKKLGERYLPREVLYRQKEGFGSPVWLWVNEYRNLYFDDLLENGYLQQNGLIDKRFIQQLTSSVCPGKHASWQYWQILVLELWMKLFVSKVDHDNIFQLDTA